MNTINRTLIVLVCVTSPMARPADVPSVSELLDRYTANQDSLSSFIAKTETVNSSKWANEDQPTFMRRFMEARVDGERIHINTQTWYRLPSRDAPTPIENAKIFYHLWDGDRYMTYRVGLRADMHRDETSIKKTINVRVTGLPFFGIRCSDDEPLDTVLRQAKTISVRDKLERAGSEDCYVIDAKTASGTYTVWIDPQHDYQIAQAEIRVGPGDLFGERTLDDNESRFLSIRNIRYENIDGIWIPMEADIHEESIKPESDQSYTIDSHHKITQITINPDHEALGSFVPVIANGTTVIDMYYGIKYTWQDGKLIPDVDEYAVDQISEMAKELKNQGQVPPGLTTTDRAEAAPNDPTTDSNEPPEAQTDSNESKRDIQAQSHLLPLTVLIVISLSIIVAVGLIVLRRLKISEK